MLVGSFGSPQESSTTQTTQNGPQRVETVDYGEFGQTEVSIAGRNFRQKFQMDHAGTRRPNAILCKDQVGP